MTPLCVAIYARVSSEQQATSLDVVVHPCGQELRLIAVEAFNVVHGDECSSARQERTPPHVAQPSHPQSFHTVWFVCATIGHIRERWIFLGQIAGIPTQHRSPGRRDRVTASGKVQTWLPALGCLSGRRTLS